MKAGGSTDIFSSTKTGFHFVAVKRRMVKDVSSFSGAPFLRDCLGFGYF